MQIFQRNILNKYIESLDISMIQDRYMRYSDYFLDPAIQENIHQSKEEQFQEGFLRELRWKICMMIVYFSIDHYSSSGIQN